MTKKTNPRKDFTQRAFDVFQQAIGEAEKTQEQLEGGKSKIQEVEEGKAQTESAPDKS